MPSLSPLRIWATARSLTRCLGSCLNEKVTGPLEPEFLNQYGDPGDAYREIFTLLPLAIKTTQLSEHTKQAILRRVVLRDHESLVRFFVAVVKAPECTHYVKELHCHADLGEHTAADRFARDIALLSSISRHLDACPISVDVLACIKRHLAHRAQRQQRLPWVVRFRQTIFLSLLGHLRSLGHLRMTIYGHDEDTLAWLRCELEHNYPADPLTDIPCFRVTRSISRVSFVAANYRSTHPWHPLALWPLTDLPGITTVEVENPPAPQPGSPGSGTTVDVGDSEADDVTAHPIYDALAYLETLHIKNFRPHPRPIVLGRLFSSFTALQTLYITGSAGTDASTTASALDSTPRVPLTPFNTKTAEGEADPEREPEPERWPEKQQTPQPGPTQPKPQPQPPGPKPKLQPEPDSKLTPAPKPQPQPGPKPKLQLDPNAEKENKEENLNTLLRTTPLRHTLLNLVLDEASPNPHAAKVLFGPTGRLEAGCLAGLDSLRVLFVHSSMLLGISYWTRGAGGGSCCGMVGKGGGDGGGHGAAGCLENAWEEMATQLPPMLERLEIVEDRYGGGVWTGEAGRAPVERSAGRITGWMWSLARYCETGAYPDLIRVVLWYYGGGDDRYAWSREEQDEVCRAFEKAGLEFEYLPYEPWPEGKVGWRVFKGVRKGD